LFSEKLLKQKSKIMEKKRKKFEMSKVGQKDQFEINIKLKQ